MEWNSRISKEHVEDGRHQRERHAQYKQESTSLRPLHIIQMIQRSFADPSISATKVFQLIVNPCGAHKHQSIQQWGIFGFFIANFRCLDRLANPL